ncbi:MAG TPA: DNA alkylation repair protein, partial [Candidatus Saccharimonadales bacterium]|nr:DNA alkylation repair protein [Candidatus Saccharimonadales bacterium]
LGRFFKTGEGQYGAGDTFIGVRVPQTRRVAKKFENISLDQMERLLESPIHEMRLCAVILMTERYKKAKKKPQEQRAIFDLYLRRTDRINNWDIVDTSCREIVGQYILDHPEKTEILRRLAKSNDIWERRIAMVSCWQFIRKSQLDIPYEIAEMLLADTHDLMHKAVGWMLRTAGDKDQDRLRDFLNSHIARIPRTALRYAVEHFEPEERQYFLKLK